MNTIMLLAVDYTLLMFLFSFNCLFSARCCAEYRGRQVELVECRTFFIRQEESTALFIVRSDVRLHLTVTYFPFAISSLRFFETRTSEVADFVGSPHLIDCQFSNDGKLELIDYISTV